MERKTVVNDDGSINDESPAKEINGNEVEDAGRPSVPEVVDLLKKVKRAAERGAIVGVAIGSILDTYQVDGCSRSRNDVVVHNLMKAATHIASLDCDQTVTSPTFERDVWHPPVPDVIEVIRIRLQFAERGTIRGVVVAFVGSDYTVDNVSVGDGTRLVDNLLVAMSAELGHAVMHATSIVPEGARIPPHQPAV